MKKFFKFLLRNSIIIGILYIGNLLGLQGFSKFIMYAWYAVILLSVAVTYYYLNCQTEKSEKAKELIENLKKVKFKPYLVFEFLWPYLAWKLNYNTIAFIMFLEIPLEIWLLFKADELRKKDKVEDVPKEK